jgi:hypothetical protein
MNGSLTATSSMSSLSSATRATNRPKRPKPLIPIRTFAGAAQLVLLAAPPAVTPEARNTTVSSQTQQPRNLYPGINFHFPLLLQNFEHNCQRRVARSVTSSHRQRCLGESTLRYRNVHSGCGFTSRAPVVCNLLALYAKPGNSAQLSV